MSATLCACAGIFILYFILRFDVLDMFTVHELLFVINVMHLFCFPRHRFEWNSLDLFGHRVDFNIHSVYLNGLV